MNKKIEKLKQIADNVGGSFRLKYSGRSMYGRVCAAIDADDDTLVVEKAVRAGIRGAKVDQMGRGVVVYWPILDTAEMAE